jgi:Zn-dependent M28 family amino/carboxypeptidase
MRLLDIVRKLQGMTREDARRECMKLFRQFDVVEEHYRTGINLVMRKPGRQQIVIAAHYDTVPGCPGANDDFSGVAVIYGIAQALWKKKLKHGLTLCIFDEEERYCAGSRAFVAQHGVHDTKAVIDLELVGMGNVVGLWPVTRQTPLVKMLAGVAKKKKLQVETIGELSWFWADYLPFREQGVDSACITLVPKEDVQLMRKFLSQNKYVLPIKIMLGAVRIPRFFETYHTPKDTADKLNEKSLQLTKNLVIDAIKSLQK